jgi:hypothetical protein
MTQHDGLSYYCDCVFDFMEILHRSVLVTAHYV